MYKTLTIKEFERMSNEYEKVKYQCKRCGHKTIIPYNVEKGLCSWCKHYVFKSDVDEFKYRLDGKRKGVRDDVTY